MTGGDRGRVVRVNGPVVEVEGLAGAAPSDVLEVGPHRLAGEVTAVTVDSVVAQVFEYTGGLKPGDPARALGRPLSVALGPGLLGGVFDGLLRPLLSAPAMLTPESRQADGPPGSWDFEPQARVGDTVEPGARLGAVQETVAVAHRLLVPPGVAGRLTWLAPAGPHGAGDTLARIGETEIAFTVHWPVRRPRPIRERLPASDPLVTGQRVVDLLYPMAKGGTAGVPGGFGTGKTVLLQQLAKWCDADVIVYVGCGERGNEMAEVLAELPKLTDPRTGRALAERTVIIANTSNMPVMAREASIYSGVTVGEYYRDMGYHVLVIADSTSRWAEALREFGSRTAQLPAEEGYPASLASALAAFYERAARVRTLGGETASVSIVGAVSPPGGDVTEPVSAHTARFVRSLWSLDRDLAYARHYPAVSWSDSFSRDAAGLAGWQAGHGDPLWSERRTRLLRLLAEADRLLSMAQLVGRSALPDRERVLLLAADLTREAVLQQSSTSANDAYSAIAKQAALADAVLAVHQRCLDLITARVPASLIEDVDLTPLTRAREAGGPAEVEPVEAARVAILESLDRLR